VAVEKTEREIGALISEIKLPEIQRGHVWKPTQVAKLIESLYRGLPDGLAVVLEDDRDTAQPGFRPDRNASAAGDPAAVPA